MRFRFQGPDFRKDVTCGDIGTLGALKSLIEAETGLAASTVQVRFGVPPKLVTGEDSEPLGAVGIRSGDRLIISSSSATGNTPSTSAKPKTSRGETKSRVVDTGIHQESIPLGEGYLVRREIPDDNSCLFHAISKGQRKVLGLNQPIHVLRQIVVNEIIGNPVEYSEVILGRSRDDYCSWIMEPNSWGGAIELAIFSSHFNIEICSIDIKSLRVDRFGEGKYSTRVLVLYSGIHYDAVALAQDLSGDSDLDQTVFPINEEVVVDAVVELARMLKERHAFTDVANFTLRCSICNASLRGQADAQGHAERTGHSAFEEYS